MTQAGSTLPILATKLTPPSPAPTLVDRPRLRQQLDVPPGCRLAVVVAPAGSGKSSLVSQWCGSQDGFSTAWLSLDEADAEPGRFLLYLCAALRQAVPEAAAPVLELLSGPQALSPDYAVTLLLNGLSTARKRTALVLDDYHRIE
jgi:LuxR family maltose regulon positive regulatory protein